jgi:hypothetical protein
VTDGGQELQRPDRRGDGRHRRLCGKIEVIDAHQDTEVNLGFDLLTLDDEPCRSIDAPAIDVRRGAPRTTRNDQWTYYSLSRTGCADPLPPHTRFSTVHVLPHVIPNFSLPRCKIPSLRDFASAGKVSYMFPSLVSQNLSRKGGLVDFPSGSHPRRFGSSGMNRVPSPCLHEPDRDGEEITVV